MTEKEEARVREIVESMLYDLGLLGESKVKEVMQKARDDARKLHETEHFFKRGELKHD